MDKLLKIKNHFHLMNLKNIHNNHLICKINYKYLVIIYQTRKMKKNNLLKIRVFII